MKQLSSELGTIDMSDFSFTTISVIKERELIYKGKRNSYFTSPTVKFFFIPNAKITILNNISFILLNKHDLTNNKRFNRYVKQYYPEYLLFK